jgi:hypothetical protein
MAAPIFFINPPIIVTMNDEMAHQLVDFLNEVIEARKTAPPAVYAFKQTLQKDLQQHNL